MSDNLISSYPNSPAGIYPAVLCKSKIVPYPRGERQVLEFLILKDNEKEPLTNEVGDNYYASIVCNPSDGTNPKSKIYKVIRAMIKEHESDPIKSSIIIPKLEHFFPSKDKPNRIVYVEVERKNKVSLISKIKNSRESNKWHPINGVFEGNQMAKEIVLKDFYQKIRRKIPHKYLLHCDKAIESFTFTPFVKDGIFISDYKFDNNKNPLYEAQFKKLSEFIKTRDYYLLIKDILET